VVLTYHCDLRLPPALASRPIELTLTLMHRLAGRLANRIVTYTRDYAEHSPFVSRYLDKVETVYPPVIQDPPPPGAGAALRSRIAHGGERLVGVAGRAGPGQGLQQQLGRP